MKASATPRAKRRGKGRGPDQGAGFFGPSDDAKATFAELDQRWSTLFAWGLKTKVHEAHGQWESWERYRASWLADEADLTALSAQTADLNFAESSARDHGFGVQKPPVRAPDVVRVSDALHAADLADHEAKALEQAAVALGHEVEQKAQEIPWWVWLGLVAVGAGVVYAAKPSITVQRHGY